MLSKNNKKNKQKQLATQLNMIFEWSDKIKVLRSYSLILLLLGSVILVLTLTPHQSVEMITFFWR